MKNTYLFTIVAEFKKGTYVSQVKSISASEALKKWIDEIDPKEIRHLGTKMIESIRAHFASNDVDNPTKIKGMRDAWFTILLTKKGVFFKTSLRLPNEPAANNAKEQPPTKRFYATTD